MYGWKIYKTLTVIGFGLLGLFLGQLVGASSEKPLPGAIIGCALLVILAIPLMRWAVAILAPWRAGYLPREYGTPVTFLRNLSGLCVLTGLVAGGMISFVVFKLSVMLFTSLAGTSLIVIGVFALIYQYENMPGEPATMHLNRLYYSNPWFLPLLLTAGTLLGILIQFRSGKGSKE